MRRLLTMLLILKCLFGAPAVVRANAQNDSAKGYQAYVAGDYAEAIKWYRKAAEQGHPDAKKLQNEAKAKIAAANRTESERLVANAHHEAAEQRRASETRRAAEAAKTKRTTKAQQIALQRLGLYDGAIDGIAGPKTSQALRGWQTSRGYSGDLTEQQTVELINSGERYVAERKKAAQQAAAAKPDSTPPALATTSGSGFFVSKLGHVVTNEHIVGNCSGVTIGDSAEKQVRGKVLATDKRNDQALLKISSLKMASADTKSLIQKFGIKVVPLLSHGLLRSKDVELGEDLVVAGYPLGETISDTIKVDNGMVSATKRWGDDSGQFQMNAPMLPGSSGGPIYDLNGSIVGVAVQGMDRRVAEKTLGVLPENVNFGIKASTLRQFLTANSLPAKWSMRSEPMSTKELAKIAKRQTVTVICQQ